MENCVFLYLVLLLLHGTGNLLAYVAALLVTSFYGFQAFVVMSHIGIRHVAEILLIRGLFLLFLISLDRAAFWLCSRKCLRSSTSPL